MKRHFAVNQFAYAVFAFVGILTVYLSPTLPAQTNGQSAATRPTQRVAPRHSGEGFLLPYLRKLYESGSSQHDDATTRNDFKDSLHSNDSPRHDQAQSAESPIYRAPALPGGWPYHPNQSNPAPPVAKQPSEKRPPTDLEVFMSGLPKQSAPSESTGAGNVSGKSELYELQFRLQNHLVTLSQREARLTAEISQLDQLAQTVASMQPRSNDRNAQVLLERKRALQKRISRQRAEVARQLADIRSQRAAGQETYDELKFQLQQSK
jgi:hypothetical protein